MQEEREPEIDEDNENDTETTQQELKHNQMIIKKNQIPYQNQLQKIVCAFRKDVKFQHNNNNETNDDDATEIKNEEKDDSKEDKNNGNSENNSVEPGSALINDIKNDTNDAG
eukprot:CAMPEP_0114691504 /NCGR_PEP_ID=MMETSP0191-20121206/66912_1 /TAXON_ID=126664 /ORGANISM="Sorites sp." /LENGTH=111 /DNA_ID=CAMNT_0001982789 /DNA_START=746 /DNA_END=1081 /DNA_ORIENTATION=-